jgi:hypothetical protein
MIRLFHFQFFKLLLPIVSIFISMFYLFMFTFLDTDNESTCLINTCIYFKEWLFVDFEFLLLLCADIEEHILYWSKIFMWTYISCIFYILLYLYGLAARFYIYLSTELIDFLIIADLYAFEVTVFVFKFFVENPQVSLIVFLIIMFYITYFKYINTITNIIIILIIFNFLYKIYKKLIKKN